jgi:hypothetical protein
LLPSNASWNPPLTPFLTLSLQHIFVGFLHVLLLLTLGRKPICAVWAAHL